MDILNSFLLFSVVFATPENGNLRIHPSGTSNLKASKVCIKQVKTIDGITELHIPPGNQPEDVLVLAKRGVPKLNRPSIRGDHLFTIKVTIPNHISGTERELLEELASLRESSGRPVRPRPTTRTQVKKTEVQKNTEAEKSEQASGQGDFWQKLKDFAGQYVDT